MTRRRLTTRLIILSIVWIVLALVATLLVISWMYRAHIEQHYDAHVFTHVEELVGAVTFDADGTPALLEEPTDPRFYRNRSGWYWQVMVGDETFARSRSLGDRELEVRHLDFEENHDVQILRESNGQKLRAHIIHFSREHIPESITIIATSPEMQIADDVADFSSHLILSFLVLAIGLSMAVVLQVVVASRSLKAIKTSISDVKAGQIDRLPKDFPADVQPLVDEMNSLLDHNETLLKRARTQLADLAHLVNTPLTVIRNAARNVHDENGQIILDQAHAMTGSIHRYLTRARSSGQNAGFSYRTSLRSVVEDVRFAVERMYPDRDIEIELCNKRDCRFRGEAQDLEEMVGNLIENACKWAQHKVKVCCRSKGDRMTVIIEDDGPGIPKLKIKSMLKRGSKLDESAPGFGQGLGIVTDIAEIYGGELKLGRSPLGGLLAELELPAAG